jgi:hypothetical protein
MGETRGMQGGGQKGIQGFCGKTWRLRDHLKIRRKLEDKIQLDLQEIRWENVDWINMAGGTEKWRAALNAAMNLRVP